MFKAQSVWKIIWRVLDATRAGHKPGGFILLICRRENGWPGARGAVKEDSMFAEGFYFGGGNNRTRMV